MGAGLWLSALPRPDPAVHTITLTFSPSHPHTLSLTLTLTLTGPHPHTPRVPTLTPHGTPPSHPTLATLAATTNVVATLADLTADALASIFAQGNYRLRTNSRFMRKLRAARHCMLEVWYSEQPAVRPTASDCARSYLCVHRLSSLPRASTWRR